MALLPDVHVNLGQVTFARIYQIFLPLVPGSALVGGLIFAHPQIAQAITITLGLGRYSRVGALICCVYVVGLVLYGFSVAITGYCTLLLGILLGWLVSKRKLLPIRRNNDTPAKSIIWRRVATEFLGTLTPQVVPNAPAAVTDTEWGDFYNVLQDYILRGTPVLHNELLLLFTYLQATGWALIYLYWRTAMRGHWSALVVSLVLIFFGATFPFSVNFFYWKYDRLTPWAFTALLINEIKMREKSNNPPGQQI